MAHVLIVYDNRNKIPLVQTTIGKFQSLPEHRLLITEQSVHSYYKSAWVFKQTFTVLSRIRAICSNEFVRTVRHHHKLTKGFVCKQYFPVLILYQDAGLEIGQKRLK